MEGSVTLWMPDQWKLEKVRHPYQRTYRDDKRARWETDDSYCDTYAMFEISSFPIIISMEDCSLDGDMHQISRW